MGEWVPRIADLSQDAIITAPVDARLLVEAGPGYGKTDVACARVATLIAGGVAPPQLLLLSFTRTAVREMRARIQQLAAAGTDVRGVEIRTLDSFAWRLRRGLLDPDARIRAFGYEESIRAVVDALDAVSPQEDSLDDVRQYLASKAHVFVDEAQDLVGARAELVVRFLTLLPASTGWTVFLDPAQAIYDWSEDPGSRNARATTFLKLVPRLGRDIQTLRLSTLHRTSNQGLVNLQTKARQVVLGRGVANRAADMRRLLLAHSDGPSITGGEELATLISGFGPQAASTLVLFRTRSEVLRISAQLLGSGVGHRLRFGAAPYAVAPWIAVVVNKIARPEFGEADFERAFASMENPWLGRGWNHEDAWRTLRRLGSSGRQVRVAKVAERLAMASLPDELTTRDVGADGPIIGTIHGSKGRESSVVLACVPAEMDDEDSDEEARVLYVAATRARDRLLVSRGLKPRSAYSDTGRVWRWAKTQNIQVEIGRPGDVDTLGALLASATGPQVQQSALSRYEGKVTPLNVSTEREARAEGRMWRRLLVPRRDAQPTPTDAYGSLTESCVKDLGSIAKMAWGAAARPPLALSFVWWIDLTTVAVGAEDPRLSRVSLPEPWSTTRIWLAPVVMSLAVAYRPGG
jgi:hypothetical protein